MRRINILSLLLFFILFVVVNQAQENGTYSAFVKASAHAEIGVTGKFYDNFILRPSVQKGVFGDRDREGARLCVGAYYEIRKDEKLAYYFGPNLYLGDSDIESMIGAVLGTELKLHKNFSVFGEVNVDFDERVLEGSGVGVKYLF